MRSILFVLILTLPAFSQETVDLTTVDRIKAEAFDHSKVMDHLYQLAEVHGPRLTWSSGFMEAANWAVTEMKEMGLQNVHTENWEAGRPQLDAAGILGRVAQATLSADDGRTAGVERIDQWGDLRRTYDGAIFRVLSRRSEETRLSLKGLPGEVDRQTAGKNHPVECASHTNVRGTASIPPLHRGRASPIWRTRRSPPPSSPPKR